MSSVTSTISLATITAHRDIIYRRTLGRRLHTADDAARWVDEVGFAFLFPDAGIEMPSLWQATCGGVRPIPNNHHDRDLGHVWGWKDSLPAQRRVFYAKLLRGKPMLVALDCAPLFYALTDNFGDEQDYLAEYEAGALTVEAKRVYEALLAQGQAAPTSVLRRVAGLEGKAHMGRFDRAVAELQRGMKIVKVGISDSNRWGYAYVYDLLPHAYPHVPEQARALSRRDARRGLLRRYLANVGAAPANKVVRLFGWDASTVDRLAEDLAAEGAARAPVEGLASDCLVWEDLRG
ncbi:MAG: winged helix DNA-binding domain-containing protein [Anaerolineae bacterium]|nr:winged helix DNA-binding domain-containing protein [Anaerolineae bacterium]